MFKKIASILSMAGCLKNLAACSPYTAQYAALSAQGRLWATNLRIIAVAVILSSSNFVIAQGWYPSPYHQPDASAYLEQSMVTLGDGPLAEPPGFIVHPPLNVDQAAVQKAEEKAAVQAKARCAEKHLHRVYSLSGLPGEIVARLATDSARGIPYGIADWNQDYNATDFGAGPRRRFVGASLNSHCALVTVDHGGIFAFQGTYAFFRVGKKWQG